MKAKAKAKRAAAGKIKALDIKNMKKIKGGGCGCGGMPHDPVTSRKRL